MDVANVTDLEVWRVGYRPNPWLWPDWRWSTDGRFPGRWDDANGNYRTLYVGSSLLACLLEVLAEFRVDQYLQAELSTIDEDDQDAREFPTAAAGTLDQAWLEERAAGTGRLRGSFCRVTTAHTLAALHPRFVATALGLGLRDFDAAALTDGRPRALTQQVSSYLYETTDVNGISFHSRHGDDLSLWAIFERPHDGPVTPRITDRRDVPLTTDLPDVQQSMRMLGLTWQ